MLVAPFLENQFMASENHPRKIVSREIDGSSRKKNIINVKASEIPHSSFSYLNYQSKAIKLNATWSIKANLNNKIFLVILNR